MTRKLIEEYEQWGLNINIEKTKYLCVSEEATDIELDNQQKIETRNQYIYLGIEFNE